QRDAVEGLLAMRDDVVAERLERLARERLIDAFSLLQADDIGRAILQPAHERFEPLPDRIDVPRSDAHEKATRSDGKAGAAAAGCGGIGVDYPERCADQIIDEIDLRAGQERHRGRIHQHDRAVARDHQIVLGLRPLDVELVLKAGTAATLDADPQHGAIALGLEDFPNAPSRPLADGYGCSHERALQRPGAPTLSGVRPPP